MPSLRSYFFRFFLKSTYGQHLPVLQQRERLEKVTKRGKIPSNIRMNPVMVNGIPARWFTVPGAPKEKVLLFLHGGGYCMGSSITHRVLVSYIAKGSGINALSLDYRLAPEHPYPAALEDSAACYGWLLEEGYKPQDIVFAGDSAGGGLALATIMSLQEQGLPLPAAVACISPWTDLEGTGESIKTRAAADPWISKEDLDFFGTYYMGDNDPTLPSISPVYGDFSGFPPILIHVGDDEILLSDSTRLADKAKKAGVEVTLKIWDNMWHDFHTFAPYLPEAMEAIAEIGTYIRGKLAGD